MCIAFCCAKWTTNRFRFGGSRVTATSKARVMIHIARIYNAMQRWTISQKRPVICFYLIPAQPLRGFLCGIRTRPPPRQKWVIKQQLIPNFVGVHWVSWLPLKGTCRMVCMCPRVLPRPPPSPTFISGDVSRVSSASAAVFSFALCSFSLLVVALCRSPPRSWFVCPFCCPLLPGCAVVLGVGPLWWSGVLCCSLARHHRRACAARAWPASMVGGAVLVLGPPPW